MLKNFSMSHIIQYSAPARKRTPNSRLSRIFRDKLLSPYRRFHRRFYRRFHHRFNVQRAKARSTVASTSVSTCNGLKPVLPAIQQRGHLFQPRAVCLIADEVVRLERIFHDIVEADLRLVAAFSHSATSSPYLPSRDRL